MIRNFARVTFDNVGTDSAVEIDSLAVVRATGTERRENASIWNASNFYFDHDLTPSGRKPNEIIYAFLTDLKPKPYLVSGADGFGGTSFEVLDLTKNLTEHDAITVYDPAELHRAAPNEYWFLGDFYLRLMMKKLKKLRRTASALHDDLPAKDHLRRDARVRRARCADL